MITAAWPPVARVGARRPLRLARRLPDLGWEPTILTPEPRSIFRSLPNMDERLSVPDIAVHRVPALIPSTKLARGVARLPDIVSKPINRLISDTLKPDQYPAWTRAALKTASSIKDIDIVWATGGPFGIFCVGRTIAKKLQVPLVLDYRDPWTVDLPKKRVPIGPSNRSVQKLEAKLLKGAQGVSYVNTDMLARNVATFSPGPDAHWVVIPNGYDPTDVAHVEPTHFLVPTIIYAGACYSSRSMLPILRALSAAQERGLPPLNLRIFGELDSAAQEFLSKHPMPDRVHCSGRIPAGELAAHMGGAAALLLIIGDGHRTALSANVFDYLEVRRPILGYGPTGCAAEDMIHRCGVGGWAHDENQTIEQLFSIARGSFGQSPNTTALQSYSADVMAERTADLLNHSLNP